MHNIRAKFPEDVFAIIVQYTNMAPITSRENHR